MNVPDTDAAFPELTGSTLGEQVRVSLHDYFRELGGDMPANLYKLVLSEVERPLLETVLHYTQGNQTRAAEVLGINRATLRKKLRLYDLD